jgi:hypothetical protein
MTSKGNWKPDVVKLVNAGEATRMAELMALKNFSDLKLVHHFTTWSMIDFLMKTKPTEFAKFLWALKRNYDAQGLPTGANLPDWHRRVFKEQLGWSYAEFDEAWRAWVLVEYTRPPGKDKDAKEKGAGEAKAKGSDPAPPQKPPEKAGQPGG